VKIGKFLTLKNSGDKICGNLIADVHKLPAGMTKKRRMRVKRTQKKGDSTINKK
jgi:hypothetical protein